MEGAGVEGYRPGDWNPEETRQLDELVKQLGKNQNRTLWQPPFACVGSEALNGSTAVRRFSHQDVVLARCCCQVRSACLVAVSVKQSPCT